MTDPRWEALADILILHSTRVEAGETLLIECFDLDDTTLPRLLVQKAAAPRGAAAGRAQGYPHPPRADQERLGSQMKAWGGCELHRMERVPPISRLRGRGTSTRWPTSPARR